MPALRPVFPARTRLGGGLRPAARGLLALGLLAALSCGGGGGSSSSPNPGAPGPSGAGGPCSPRQVKADILGAFRKLYLWPELLPSQVDLDAFATPEDLVTALTAKARAAGKDRGWSHLTADAKGPSLSLDDQEGYGFRLAAMALPGGGQGLRIKYVFHGSPAAQAGLERGDQLVAVAGAPKDLDQAANQLVPGNNWRPLYPLLFPDRAGVVASLRVRRVLGGPSRTVTLTAGTWTTDPVPGWNAPRILTTAHSHKVGYLPLLEFTERAKAQLRSILGRFRADRVTDLIVDLRYNPGGLREVAELFANLLHAAHAQGEVMANLHYSPASGQKIQTRYFKMEPEAMEFDHIAFIVTGDTASASEMLANVLEPSYGSRLALVGQRTYGKAVGASVYYDPNCHWRLQLVTFIPYNAKGGGNYVRGLPYPGFGAVTCSAEDDLDHALGDPDESSTAAALAWISTGVPPGPPFGAVPGLPADEDAPPDTVQDLGPEPSTAEAAAEF